MDLKDTVLPRRHWGQNELISCKTRVLRSASRHFGRAALRAAGVNSAPITECS